MNSSVRGMSVVTTGVLICFVVVILAHFNRLLLCQSENAAWKIIVEAT